MKKGLFFFILLIISIKAHSQCPLSVGITSVPDVTIIAVCKSTPVQLQANPSAGAVAPQYIWVVNGDTISSTGSIINILANNQNIQVYMATSTGCPQDTVFTSIQVQTVIITSSPVPIITECNQTVADVEITSTGGTSPYNYDLVGIGTSSTGSYTNVPQGNYILYTTDSNGCTDTNQVTITPFECPPPSPAEVITPNGDGINDTWVIYNIQFYPDNEVFVFDRWGQRVYHKNEYDNLDGWDVKYLGGNMPVTTYYYILKVNLEKSDDLVFKGAISVFR
ncbi:MAG: hypothetical protein COA97_02535 [Flavobacteriales bacterium]|nr:MAG: hypothetical protein COA97_02535 [Flavobacteriales bacterium]